MSTNIANIISCGSGMLMTLKLKKKESACVVFATDTGWKMDCFIKCSMGLLTYFANLSFYLQPNTLETIWRHLVNAETAWPLTVCLQETEVNAIRLDTPGAFYSPTPRALLIATIFRSIGRWSASVIGIKSSVPLSTLYCARAETTHYIYFLSLAFCVCLGQVFSENCKQFKPHTLCRCTGALRVLHI